MGRADGKGCGREVLIEEGWKDASKLKVFSKLYEFDRVSLCYGGGIYIFGDPMGDSPVRPVDRGPRASFIW
jgi:hypothetical protein